MKSNMNMQIRPMKKRILKERLRRKKNLVVLNPPVSSTKKNLDIIIISDSDDDFEIIDEPIKFNQQIPRPIYCHSLDIPEIPVVYPTAEEFASPLKLIQRLYGQGYHKYGLVKIKPPKDWKPKFIFDSLTQKVNTRIQVINDLTKGKPYEINYAAYTFSQYKSLADKFEEKFVLKNPLNIEDRLRANEYDFWSYVENKPNFTNKVKVEYAADLPSKRYGSAFLTELLSPSEINDAAKHYFNLNHINNSDNSLFQYANKSKISGIMSPWVYMGMLFSCFCWHIEDLYMYSINYMHVGKPKTWYSIPGDYKDEFENLMKKSFPHVFKECPDILHQITLMLSPSEVKNHRIPIFRTDQHPGDFIITFPKVYHAGFSHGFNCAEAVNVTIPEWIKDGKEAIGDYAKAGFLKKVSFPLEWLLLQNYLNMPTSRIDKNSRDMIKKEFESMVNTEVIQRNNVRKIYSDLEEIVLFNPNEKYDKHHCNLCKNYTYLSFLMCSICRKQACTSHITVCNCLNSQVLLHKRFSDEDLKYFVKNFS